MASDPNRFQAPSDRLKVSRLLAETYRVTAWGLLAGIGILAGVFLYFIVASKERPAPPPALTRLIIRKPRATKPFVLKRQRLRPRAMTKQVTTLNPRLQMPAVQRLATATSTSRFFPSLDHGQPHCVCM